MTTIEDHIARHAARLPHKAAVVSAAGVLTYADLQTAIVRQADALLSGGLRPGSAVPLRAVCSADTIVSYFAIHRAGGVAVPYSPQTAPPAVGDWTGTEPAADILYTTGTTGQAKGAVISHRAIAANAENLIAAQGFSEDLLFVINGPLNHIGSLSKLWPVMQTGGTVSLVDGLKDFNAFFAAFDFTAAKTATFLVPTAARMLLRLAPERLLTLKDRMDFIELGAAPLTRQDMTELCRAFPDSRLYNTYASTETGIVCTYNFNDGECVAGCVGHTMRNARIRLGDDGLIACSGSMTMSGYAGDEAATARVMKGKTVFTADRGRLDEQGRLILLGRNDDVINVGGYKVNPTDVEEAAMAVGGISDCICVADTSPDGCMTTLRLLVVEETPGNLRPRELARALAQRLERHQVPTKYEAVEYIRRTFNGKPDRKFYRK